MANPTDNCKAERRHMPAHVYATYDAMRACIGDDPKRVYFGGIYKLANLNNRNVQSERDNLEWLEREGWAICLNPTAQRRFHGKHDKDEYRVLWHDEWLAAQKGRECPPDKYVKVGDAWKLAKPGELAPALWLGNLKAAAAKAGVNLDELEPDDRLLALALLAAYRQEKAVAAIPAQAVAAIPATPVAALPARSFTPSGTESETTSPTFLHETRLDGGQEVSSPSFAGAGHVDAEEEWRRNTDKMWQRFMTALPEEMQGAILRKDYRSQLEAQIEASDPSVVLAALRLWIDERELPIADRKADKWGCWLAEGAPFLKRAVDNWRKRNRETRLWEFKTKIAPSIPPEFFDSDLSFGKADRNNCEKVMAPTFAFPAFDEQERFTKWETFTEDIRSRYQLWADKDDCEEVQAMRAYARAQIAERRAEAQAAKA